jgi:hypothetical protein
LIFSPKKNSKNPEKTIFFQDFDPKYFFLARNDKSAPNQIFTLYAHLAENQVLGKKMIVNTNVVIYRIPNSNLRLRISKLPTNYVHQHGQLFKFHKKCSVHLGPKTFRPLPSPLNVRDFHYKVFFVYSWALFGQEISFLGSQVKKSNSSCINIS